MDDKISEILPSGAIDPSIRRLFLTVFPSIMLPMFLGVADQTIVASALPTIAAQMGHPERISWVVVSYLLAVTIAAPVYGYLGDMFGRRRLMVVAVSVFIGASALCAAAPTITLLSAARALQGLGGGGLMSLSQALVGEVVPPRQRGHFQGYLAANVTASSAFGPVAGGLLTEHFGWPSIFLINIPLGLAAIALAFRLPGRAGGRAGGWRFDFGGLFLLIAGVSSILLALQMLERPDVGSFASAGALLVLALVAVFVLIRYERGQAQPLIPLSLLHQRPVWMADALVVCNGAALTSLVAFIPLFMRVIHGATATESGLLLLPVTIGVGLGAILTGRMITWSGRTMAFPSGGLACATGILVLFAWFSPRLPPIAAALFLGCAALFLGTVMSVVQVTVQGVAGSKMLGAAAASVQLSRSIGSAVGTALFSTVLFASLFIYDPHAGLEFSRVVDLGPDALRSLNETARDTFVFELSHAFRTGFLMVCAFTAIGCALAWLNPNRRV